jgi:hypothetical protein
VAKPRKLLNLLRRKFGGSTFLGTESLPASPTKSIAYGAQPIESYGFHPLQFTSVQTAGDRGENLDFPVGCPEQYTALTSGWADNSDTVYEANAIPEVFAIKTVGQATGPWWSRPG